MRKIILILSFILLSSSNVSALENNDIKACEALSDKKMVCSINKDGVCECEDTLIIPFIIDRPDGGD